MKYPNWYIRIIIRIALGLLDHVKRKIVSQQLLEITNKKPSD